MNRNAVRRIVLLTGLVVLFGGFGLRGIYADAVCGVGALIVCLGLSMARDPAKSTTPVKTRSPRETAVSIGVIVTSSVVLAAIFKFNPRLVMGEVAFLGAIFYALFKVGDKYR
jgi:hypothetical protein